MLRDGPRVWRRYFCCSHMLCFCTRRKESISWGEAALVLVLFGAAVKTKENAVALAPILMLRILLGLRPSRYAGCVATGDSMAS